MTRRDDAVCRALLRVYPPQFRARYGTGMRHAFAEELTAARGRGLRAHAAFWAAALAQALAFGFVERVRPYLPHRAPGTTDGAPWSAVLSVDWRDAWRALRGAPLVTCIAVLSLALGIGANTALFSILNTLVLKPLPVQHAERLALLDGGSWTNPIWEEIRARQFAIGDGACAWATDLFDISTSGTSDLVEGLYVSGNAFEILGVPAALGRTLTAGDDDRSRAIERVAVISHGFWQRRFGGTGDVLGRSLVVEGLPFTIVGVTAREFFGPVVGRSFDVALPIAAEPQIARAARDERLHWWLEIILRARPGQSVAQLQQALEALRPQMREASRPAGGDQAHREEHLNTPFELNDGRAGDSPLRRQYRQPLAVILVVVGLVLLIACANIANLLLARAVARRHELSVRLALGASRFRLSRQLLAESLMLAGAGAALGLLLARWGGRALVAQLSTFNRSVFLDLTFDWRVLGFTTAVAAVTAVVFGMAPAFGISGVAPQDALREHGRGVPGGGNRVRAVFVVLQVALSLALLVGAGLFTQTFVKLLTRDAGFERRGVLVVTVDSSGSATGRARRPELFERLREAAASAPGASHVSASFTTPVTTRGWNSRIAMPPGSGLGPRERMSWKNAVTPGWFQTFGISVRAGRDFAAGDRAGGPPVAVVNRAFARRFLNTDQPVGMRVREDAPPGQSGQAYDVVGVVEDVVYRSLRAEMAPVMYIPLAQWQEAPGTVVIAARPRAGEPLALAPAIADAVLREEPGVKVSFHSLENQIAASLTQERLMATLSALFAGLAVVLAALGLYGVTAYAVNRRRTEIGIRMALGADSGSVVRLVLRRLAVVVATGLVLGAVLSAWVTRYAASLLYGLEPLDLPTFGAAVLILTAVAAVAGWLPARRASRIDPTSVLRQS